jgi:hypothetical protein
MRKHGFDNFEMILINAFENKQNAVDLECSLISLDDDQCLNLAPGGEGGWVVVNKNDWLNKLSVARQGGKPALGMKHAEENKKKFGEFGRLRWDIYGRYPIEVTDYSFLDANKQFGISKTHYYRLLKQAKINDLS